MADVSTGGPGDLTPDGVAGTTGGAGGPRMAKKPTGIVLVLACSFAGIAATASPAGRETTSCGVLAALRDRAAHVRLGPHLTTIQKIARRPMPRPTPRRRQTIFQRNVWRVVAQITQYRLGAAGGGPAPPFS